jgi:ribosome-binding ATPase
MMPKVGIEPTLPKEHDFESCASASSATPAKSLSKYTKIKIPVKSFYITGKQMRLGIIGLPQSGKTTIFNALTRGDLPVTTGGGRFDVHTAVVDVPDERVDRLSHLFKPKKTIYAKVTYADIAGLDGSAGKAGISGALLNQLSQMDGFVQVVRAFENDLVPHPSGSLDPQRDLQAMEAELLINDLIAVERKLERLGDERRKGAGRDKGTIEKEWNLFQRLHQVLSEDRPLRGESFSEEEEKILSGFGLLTLKPMLVLLNLGEGQAAPQLEFNQPGSGVFGLQGKLEMDIAQLSAEEAEVFMSEFGIEEMGLNRVISLSYDLLGLQSFFTVGPDEVRAWTIERGASAFEAAGAIHSDLQRGFIRAEVIYWEELLALGGLNEAKAKGKLRLEGKEYVVKDGEIVHIRFNI